MAKRNISDAWAMNLLFESDENESDFEIDEEFSDLSSDDSDQEAFDSGSEKQKRDHDISKSDYSDNEVDSSDPRKYINVSANDSEPSKIQFSVGQKVVGPIIPCDCETPLQLFKLFFTDELVTKIVVEPTNMQMTG